LTEDLPLETIKANALLDCWSTQDGRYDCHMLLDAIHIAFEGIEGDAPPVVYLWEPVQTHQVDAIASAIRDLIQESVRDSSPGDLWGALATVEYTDEPSWCESPEVHALIDKLAQQLVEDAPGDGGWWEQIGELTITPEVLRAIGINEWPLPGNNPPASGG